MRLQLAVLAVLLPITAAADSVRLAYSQRLGVEVFAESESGSWCQDEVELRLVAEQASFFEAAHRDLLIKVGAVLAQECGKAASATINGETKDGTPVYEGMASAASGWLPQAKTTSEIAMTKPRTQQVVSSSASAAAASNATKTERAPSPEPDIGSSVSESEIDTTRFFAVGGWTPPQPGEAVVSQGDMNEVEIFSRDRSCKLFFPKGSLRESLVYLELKAGSCENGLVEGPAEVEIIRNDGRSLRIRMRGNFSKGYFTGKHHMKYPLIAKFVSNRRNWLAFWLDSDVRNKTHYIAYLVNHRNGYRLCARYNGPSIAVLTDDRRIFLDKDRIDLLVNTAGTYAEEVCAGSTEMSMIAAPGFPEDSSNEFYRAKARLDQNGNWNIDPRYATNNVMDAELKRLAQTEQANAQARREAQREMQRREQANRRLALQRQAAWERIKREYDRLNGTSRLVRLHYYHSGSIARLESALLIAAISLIRESTINATVMVRVDDLEGNSAITGWPNEMELYPGQDVIAETGWHIVSGELTALQNAVDSNGYIKAEMKVDAFTACEQTACAEADDVLSLVRDRHNDPFWSPDTPNAGASR